MLASSAWLVAVQTFQFLSKFQGCCIPALVSCGYAFDGMLFYIATSIVEGNKLDDVTGPDITSAHLEKALKVRV